jgi:amino acid adenylation domain-containing protein
VGFFVNTVVLRGRFDDNPTAREFLDRTRKGVIAAMENQDAPFDLVLEKLHLPRPATHTPLAQVGFNYVAQQVDTTAGKTVATAGLTIEVLEQQAVEAKYEMIWGLQDATRFRDNEIELAIEYATHLYEEATVVGLAGHFEKMAGRLLDNLDTPVQRIALLSAEEIRQEIAGSCVDIETVLPLTPMQRDLYLDTLINPDSPRNNLGSILRTGRTIDAFHGQRVIDLLTTHYSALRLRLIESGRNYLDIAYALVLKPESPEARITLQMVDWSGEALSDEAFDQRCHQLCFRPFAIGREAPLRFFLIRDHHGHDTLLVTAHHTSADGVSVQLLTTRFIELYLAGAEQPPTLPPDLFPDYVQQQYVACDNAESFRFFREQAAGVEALSSSLGIRTPAREPLFVHIHYKDEAAHLAAIAAYCQQNGSSTAQYLRAIYGILLQGYCHAERDFTITDILAARPRAHAREAGCYFEERPVILPAGAGSFREMLARMDENRKKTGNDKHLSNSLQARLFPRGNAQFIFNFYITGRSLPFGGEEADYRIIAPEMESAVNFMVMQDGDALRFHLAFSDNIFEHRRFVERFLHLSRQILAGADTLDSLQFLLPDEKALLPSPEKPSYPERSVIRLIEAQCRNNPETIATCDSHGALGYGELNRQANRLADYLSTRHGIERGQRVALCHSAENRFLVALLAILKCGASYIPVDPNYPPGRIRHILADSGSPCILTERCLSESLAAIDAIKIFLDEAVIDAAGLPATDPQTATLLDDPLYTIYTSGSTGLPKGATVTQRGELNLLTWYNREYGITVGERVLIISATGFDLTQKNLLGPLVAGATVVFPEQEGYDPEKLAGVIHHQRITLINCAPSAFYPLAENEKLWPQLASLRLVLFGGEPIRMAALIPWLQQAGSAAQLVNMYGPTECTDIATAYRITTPQDFLGSPVPIGRPNDNVVLFVADPRQRLLPDGLTGELLVGGEGVGLGYHNRPELTAEKFIHHPVAGRVYRTGDLVRRQDDGNYLFVGRIDHQVKLRGLRIELGEIEYALRRLPDVSDSLAMVRGESLVGYILTPDGKVPENWRTLLAAKLPQYMIPQAVAALLRWPLTANGKIDRAALPDPLQEGKRECVAPRSDTERELAAIWCDVLGIDQVGVFDNFFELGGHSLLAARAVARIRDRFRQELPLGEIFHTPTIAAIAERLDSGNNGVILPPLLPVDREPFAGKYPLSFAQQRLWFIDRLQPGSPLYHMPFALTLRGKLDTPALSRAFDSLAERHESLRTRIVTEGGEAFQIIDPPQPGLLGSFPIEEGREELANRVTELALAPFSLSTGPLLRAELLHTVGSDEYLLLVVLHHIVADGLSIEILVRDLLALYRFHHNATDAQLPALPVQYVDYTLWQRMWLDSERLEQQAAYWKETLAGHESLELPTDFPRPAVLDPAGCQQSFELTAEQSRALRELSKQEGTTLFMTMMAALALLLGRYSNQEDINIGTPVANRNQPELEGLIGLFLNTLVIRTFLDEKLTFRELLAQVKNTTINAYQHQETPFELLVDTMKVPRELSRTPLFQVMLILQGSTQGATHDLTTLSRMAESVGGVTIEPYGGDNGGVTAKFDITLNILDTRDHLRGVIEYRTSLFRAETIARLARHFVALLDAICTAPQSPIYALSFISDEERREQLDFAEGWNATAHEYPPCAALHLLIEQQAESSPDLIAVRCEAGQLTYRELNEEANRLAHYLLAAGVKPGEAVGVCLYRSHRLSVALLAILKAGGCYVPFDPEFPEERLAFMATDTAIRFLVTDESNTAGQAIPVENRIFIGNHTAWAGQPCGNPLLAADGERCFNIIYTSGSTGKPKGVMVPHRGIINRLRWMQHEYPIGQGDRVLQKTPYSFDVSVWELFWPLMEGATLVYAKPGGHKDPAYLRDLIIGGGITTLHFVPSMLGIFLMTEGVSHCGSLRQVFCSGEALQLEHSRAFYRQLPHARLHNLYGPTEASVDVSYYPCVAEEPHRSVPIGKPIHNTQLHILDRAFHIVPVGVAGELFIGGEGLALGYLNRDELSRSSFIHNPLWDAANPACHPSRKLYRTGDVARYFSDGTIEYLGRTDHQVKVRGLRIELGEIESRLQKLSGIRESIVMARSVDGRNENQQLIAYLLQGETATDTTAIRAALLQQLPDYMVPVHYVVLDAWPLSANGKIDRKALPLPDLTQRGEYVAPCNATEEKLASLWEEILGCGQVGVHDNFFEMGGHSLAAMRLVAAIARDFSIELPVRVIFESPTVATLALRLLDTGLCRPALPPIPSMPRDGRKIPLSLNQQRLWFIQQMAPESAAYNMPISLRLSGKLNLAALQQAVDTLLARHEIFRTRLVERDGEACQEILPEVTLPLVVEPIEPGTTTETLLAREAAIPFNLGSAPLLRLKLWTLGDEEFLLQLTLHHIIADAFTLELLVRELGFAYLAATKGETPALPALPFQYADFSLWQREVLEGAYLEPQMAWWREQLQGAPLLLNLPTDRPRTANPDHRGATYTATLDTALVTEVREQARRAGMTPFMLLLGALQLLLGRYARQEDVCIGVPVAGRHLPGTEQLAGFFVNALVLRNRFGDNPDSATFLLQVKELVLAAFAHQDAPFERVIEEAARRHPLTHNPIVQVGFNYLTQAPGSGGSSVEGLRIEPVSQPVMDAKYDLIWSFVDGPEGITATIEYATALFDESTVSRLLGHFHELARNLLANPATPVLRLPLVRQEELQREIANHCDHAAAILPLTPMMRDIYLDTLIDPQNRRNYFGWIQRIPQAVDGTLLQQALDIITAHFSALRIRIVSTGRDFLDIAHAVVLDPAAPESRITLRELDWRDRNLTEAAFNRACNEELAFVPYDLAREPNLRFFLIRTGEESSAIVLTAHHANIDGISLQVITDSYTKVYEALLSGGSWQLPVDLYPQYLAAQHALCDNRESHHFWQQEAQGVDALSTLQGSRQPQGNYTLLETIDTPQHFAAITAFCEQHNTTPTLYLKALYTVLLQGYTHAEGSFYFADILAARPKGHLAQAGCYFEQKPTVIRPDRFASPTFTALLTWLDDFRKRSRNTHLSNRLQGELFPRSQLQFLFNHYLTERHLPFNGSESSLTFIVPEMGNAVTFTAIVERDHYVFNLTYTDNLFEENRFVERLLHLSHQVLSGVDRLDALTLCLPGEGLPGEGEMPAPEPASYPANSLRELITRQVAKSPYSVAVVDGKQSLTYIDLHQKACRLARYLIEEEGVRPGDRIALCHSAECGFITALVATLYSGAAYLPVDPSYPQGRIRYLLEDSACRCTLTESCLLPQLEGVPGRIIAIDHLDATLARLSTSQPKVEVTLDDPLYVIYTSGSTGQPKGAVVSQRGELNLLGWYLREYAITPADRFLVISATGFDLTQKNLLGPLVAGATIVFPAEEGYDPAQLVATIAAQRITIINSAPSAFYPLAEREADWPQLSTLRLVLFGGEPIRMGALIPWLLSPACHAQLVNMYGPTECTDIAAAYRITEPQRFLDTPVPIGTPNDRVRLHVVDAALRPLPPGIPGELLIGGEGVGPGYLHRPELTAEKFIHHPLLGRLYRTGDRVVLLADGNYRFLGRIDQQVKLRGLRIEPGEIEFALRKLPAVSDSLVMVRGDNLVAYVITGSGNEPDDWQSALAHELPGYMVPQAVVALTSWPLTPNGKIDRAALPDPAAGERPAPVAPRNQTEERLAAIWREVLGIEEVGIHDNFFTLGGHSLLAARAVARIRDQFQRELPLRELFHTPTIAAIAQVLDQREPSASRMPALLPADRAPYQGRFPLSFAQERLWLVEQIQSSGTMYSIPIALALQGSVNRAALQQAVAALVARHESLRTRIGESSGIPFQYLAPAEDFSLATVEAASTAECNRQVVEFLRQPFTLANRPLFAARLVSHGNDHLLLLNSHHIISDGLSSNILLQELGALYQRTCSGEQSLLEPLTVHYIDYTLWQRQWLTDSVLEEQVGYWRRQLANAPILALPIDHPRSARNSTAGKTVTFEVGRERSRRLLALAREENVTPFMLLLGAFQLLLFRYSGQSDILVGTPVANRPLTALERVIGLFVNTLVIRSELVAESRFADFLAQLRETTTQALLHQDLPFERLLDELDIPRDLSHSPLFQAFFSLQNAAELSEKETHEISGMSIRAWVPPEGPIESEAKFELYLSMLENGGELSGIIEYRSALFEESTIQRLSAHFCQLLEAIADNPHGSIATLPFITAEEKRQQLGEQGGLFNAPTLPVNQSQNVQLLLEEQAERTPEAIAVSDPASALTYREFNRRVNQLTRYLLENRQLRKNARIAICLPGGVEFLVSVHAAVKAAACYIPIDPCYPEERIRHIVSDAGADIILCDRESQSLFAAFAERCLCLTDEAVRCALQQQDAGNPDNRITPETPLYIIYTSGSTGQPKGVEVIHQGETNLVHWYTREYGFGGHDRFLIISNIGFDLTQKNLLAPLCVGGEVVFPCGEYDPDAILHLVSRKAITVINGAPSALYPLIENPAHDALTSSLRTVLLGGEPIRIDTVRAWLVRTGFRCELVNMYGPTECTDISTTYRIRSAADIDCPVIPIGTPIPNVPCFIVDPNGQLLPLGAVGELVVGGLGLSNGYLNNPERNAESFFQNLPGSELSGRFYRTGDLARYRDDGNILYIGRRDHQVKIRGLRIELGEIEAALCALPDISEALVVALRHNGEDLLVAYLKPARPTEGMESGALRTLLSRTLPGYMIPSLFLTVESWPLSPNGKIDRKALPAPTWITDSEREQVLPRNPVEEVILSIWSEVLHLPAISVDDNFFAIGGHSLKAAQVAARLRQALAVDISMRELFDAQTITELALLVHVKQQQGGALPAISRIERSERMPLSFAQQRLWFLAQLDATSPAYNMPAAFRLKGALDTAALTRAFAAMAERHEVLRCHFAAEEGEPFLVIDQTATIPLVQRECASEREMVRAVAADAKAPFQLAEGPLLRATLLSLDDDDHCLLLNMHHIISDGISVQVFLRELITLYLAFHRNLPSPLLPQPIEYADYAAWQRNYLQGEVLAEQVDFWKKTLANAPVLLNLPHDRPRPPVQSFRGALFHQAIPNDLSLALRELSRAHGCTLFMSCLAAFTLLLHKYSRQEDICIGIPLAGRSLPGTENLIGFFINALIIRTDLSANLSLTELLESVKEATLAAFAHDQIPAEMMLNELGIERSLAYTPVAQCAFNMMTADSALLPNNIDQLLDGLSLSAVESSSVTSKFDLQFSLLDSDNRLMLSIEYATDLFDESTMARMAEHYLYILTTLAEAHKSNETRHLHEIHLGDFAIPHGYVKTLPLTLMQRDIYLASLARPDTRENSLGFSFTTPFAIDAELWREILVDITTQFEILRAEVIANDKPWQDIAYLAIREEPQIDFELLDWSHLPLTPADIRERIDQLVSKPYEVSRSVATSYRLIRLGENRYWATMAAHHMILDGFAAVLLGTYLTSLYEKRKQGDNSEFIASDPFANYVAENRRQFDHRDTVAFWREQLARTTGLSAEGGKESTQHLASLPIPTDHYQEIKKYCKQQRITPPFFFKCLFAILIRHYTRTDSPFAITEFHAGRDRDTKDALGCFYHTYPTVFDTAAINGTLAELFESARRHQKESRDFLQISHLLLSRLLPRSAVHFSYNYLMMPHESYLLGEHLTGTRYTPNAEGAVDLRVQAWGEELCLWLAFRENLFADHQFLNRMLSLSRQLVTGTISHSRELSLVLPEDCWSLEAPPMPDTPIVPMQVSLMALASPASLAVVCGENMLSYRELEQLSNRFAHALLQQGVKRGDRVGICVGRRVELIAAILGVMKAGGCYIPLDPAYPADRIAYICQDAAAAVIITEACCRELLANASSTLLDLDDAEIKKQPATLPKVKVAADDLIYLVYTSGSTGQPKGASVFHKSEANLVAWYVKEYGFTRSDRTLVISSAGFDLTQKNFFALLTVGGTVVLPDIDHYDPVQLRALVAKHHITHLNCAPSAFYPMVEEAEEKLLQQLATLKTLCFGGEPIQLKRMERWIRPPGFACTIANMYGPTECTDISTAFTLTASEVKRQIDEENVTIPLGRPSAGVKLFVLNENRQPVPEGLAGELCVAGTAVGGGYWMKPELTDTRLCGEPLRQGPR